MTVAHVVHVVGPDACCSRCGTNLSAWAPLTLNIQLVVTYDGERQVNARPLHAAGKLPDDLIGCKAPAHK